MCPKQASIIVKSLGSPCKERPHVCTSVSTFKQQVLEILKDAARLKKETVLYLTSACCAACPLACGNAAPTHLGHVVNDIHSPAVPQNMQAASLKFTLFVWPIFLNITVSLYVRMLECSSPQVLESSSPRVLKSSSARVLDCSSLRVNECSSPRVLESSSERGLDCSSPRVLESSNPRVLESSSARVLECLSARVL